jgi:Fe-S cluster assembly protein SufD
MRSLSKGEVVEQILLNEANLDLHFVQSDDSVLRLFVLNLSPADKTTVEIYVDQQGRGCRTEVYSLNLLRDEQRCSMHTHITHSANDGQSLQLIKFVLNDKAKGEFYGELKIQPDVRHIDAQQTNRNLLLTDEAEMRTRPQLEIYADDVKAGHGASTGQLDDQALFYMQQRGIGRDEARRMLIAAFCKDMVMPLSNEAKRTELMETIDRIV